MPLFFNNLTIKYGLNFITLFKFIKMISFFEHFLIGYQT
jgi:hypothetical protein